MKRYRVSLLVAPCILGLLLGTLALSGCSKKAKEEGGSAEPATKTQMGGPGHGMGPGHGHRRHGGDMGHGDGMGHGRPAAHVAHWGYAGDTGPAKWGDLSPDYAACKAGKAQSPVDIVKPAEGKSEPLLYSYQAGGVALVDNGHTIMWKVHPGSKLARGDATWELKQVHFHAPSEHTVEGKAFAAEAHLVHMGKGGKLAVVGVLFEVGAENPVLAKLWSHFPLKKGRWIKVADGALNPMGLLPKKKSTWRYPGSLTTPPCTEGISWFVMTTPQTLSEAQLKAFQAAYSGNARPVQPLNGRTVVLSE